jgi:uncharacterized membrane protein
MSRSMLPRESSPPPPEIPETLRQRMQFHFAVAAALTAAGLGIAWCLVEQGPKGLLEMFGVLALAQIVGKWLIFSGVIDRAPYGPWTVATIILVAELIYSVAMAAGMMRLERTRWIGPWIRRTRERADRAFSRYPGLRRMAFTGVALWVFLPLPASGAVTGSFAARLTGLSRSASVAAVMLGSVATSAVFAGAAQFLGKKGEELLRNPLALVLATVVLAVFLWIAWIRVKRALEQA